MTIRRALAALALCALTVLPAAAQTHQQVYGYYNGHVPRLKHIAVVSDYPDTDSLAVLGIGNSSAAAAVYVKNQALGRIWAALREQGATVDFYSSNYFRTGGGSNFAPESLWAHIGRKHAVVVCVNFVGRFTNEQAGVQRRYFCPDSFNTSDPEPHVIHVGTVERLRDADTTTAASTYGTSVGWFSTNQLQANDATRDTSYFSFLTPRGDSIGFNGCVYAVRNPVLHTNVSQVVQLFRPASNVGADQFRSTVAYSGIAEPVSTVFADSVASAAEVMPVAWRVYWNSGKWMDYVLMSTGNAYTDCTGHVLQALINRYTTLDPLRISYEWDDHGTLGLDDSTTAFNGSVPLTRWPKTTTMTPWIAQMDSMGIKWGTTGPGDSLYAMATTAQGQNGDKGPYTYLSTRGSRMPFVAHIHDSTTARPFSSILGVGSQTSCTSNCTFSLPMRAFSANASPTFNYDRWGIYQRLKQNDSLYTAKFGGGRVVPYLSFPTDAGFPLMGRSKNGTLAISTYPTCPPDSFMQAFALAGKTTLRQFVAGQDPDSLARTLSSLTVAPGLMATQAKRYFSYPGERYVVDIPSDWAATGDRNGGRRQSIVNIGASTSGILSALPIHTKYKHYRSAAQVTIPELLHIRYQAPRTVSGQAGRGEASQLLTTATGDKDCNKNDDTAFIGMIYQHPYANAMGGSFGNLECEKEWFRIVVRDPLAALSGIAGKDYWRWVYPWELYADR